MLDINLPRISGIEVLRQIKSRDEWKKIPVVMLTSSSTQEDVNASYSTHANAYVQKNIDLETHFQALDSIYGLFLRTAILPD